MFDLTQANIDHGHGHCRVDGKHGLYCGNHCSMFKKCPLRNSHPEEMVMVRIGSANGGFIEIPMTTKEKMQYAFTMGREALNMSMPAPTPEPEKANYMEEMTKSQPVEDVKEEVAMATTNEDLEDNANETAGSDTSVNELIDESAEEVLEESCGEDGYVDMDGIDLEASIDLPIITTNVENLVDSNNEDTKKKEKKKEFSFRGGKPASNKGYGDIKFTTESYK